MSPLKNKEILSICPEYYEIINYEIMENDPISIKILQIYQEYVFSIDIKNSFQVELVKKLSEAVKKYKEDNEFKKELINVISTLKLRVGEENILEFIAKKIVESYNKYLEFYTRNLYIPRWI